MKINAEGFQKISLHFCMNKQDYLLDVFQGVNLDVIDLHKKLDIYVKIIDIIYEKMYLN